MAGFALFLLSFDGNKQKTEVRIKMDAIDDSP